MSKTIVTVQVHNAVTKSWDLYNDVKLLSVSNASSSSRFVQFEHEMDGIKTKHTFVGVAFHIVTNKRPDDPGLPATE